MKNGVHDVCSDGRCSGGNIESWYFQAQVVGCGRNTLKFGWEQCDSGSAEQMEGGHSSDGSWANSSVDRAIGRGRPQ